jgi:hypothetical protein
MADLADGAPAQGQPAQGDLERATDLMQEIGGLVVGDERYAGEPWASIALVTMIDGPVQRFHGFWYDAAGEATPGFPRNRDLLDKFRELQAVARNGERTWKTALVQIRRDDMQITVDYEYEDPQRWKVTPLNLEAMREALRPR